MPSPAGAGAKPQPTCAVRCAPCRGGPCPCPCPCGSRAPCPCPSPSPGPRLGCAPSPWRRQQPDSPISTTGRWLAHGPQQVTHSCTSQRMKTRSHGSHSHQRSGPRHNIKQQGLSWHRHCARLQSHCPGNQAVLQAWMDNRQSCKHDENNRFLQAGGREKRATCRGRGRTRAAWAGRGSPIAPVPPFMPAPRPRPSSRAVARFGARCPNATDLPDKRRLPRQQQSSLCIGIFSFSSGSSRQ